LSKERYEYYLKLREQVYEYWLTLNAL
jgi:hypothetical protein